MPIPDFQSIMLPLLERVADSKEHSIAQVREELATHFNVTAEEQAQLLPSGRVRLFLNRVAWAKTYLQVAQLIQATKRGHFRITARGKEVLRQPPPRIDIRFLDQFPEFVESRKHKDQRTTAGFDASAETPVQTPEETIETASQQLRTALAGELLARVKSGSPSFFERLVVELLIRMGYGGSRREAGEAIGHSGDEGVDGIINEDRLGLDTIYVQAKRWEGTVGRPEIQRFVGALHGKRAKKGVFITTGTFSAEALDYVLRIDPKVVLIDGHQLAGFMIDFNLGVAPVATFETKRVDSDFFEEE
jgi:restriction system protein